MSQPVRQHLYLPERDRSFWKADEVPALPLLYLAWGSRDFNRRPIPVSRHQGWVCVLVEEGAPTMVVRRQEVTMPAGTLAVIGPECPFGWKGSATGSCRFLLWMWREVAGTLAGADLQAANLARRLARPERKPFVLLHDLCRREVLRSAGPGQAYLEGCRILFEATIQRELLETRDDSPGPSELVTLARHWIDAHLDSQAPIARLCDYLNVSQSTLYRLVVAEVGLSPLTWFHRTRMAKAQTLIEGSGHSVKETAYALGYEHANDLSRAYRRHFGHSPSEGRPPIA
ncbi:MAG: helix-turn-helix transcriptional regulator [Acidobacteria bacterium]|nr:helix-turn-helix transcriptional regulator [Acidobacteriota bacterium]